MPFVPVPKDLNRVKSKIAFNLTKRQLICFSLAGAIAIPTYLYTRNYIGNDFSVILMVTLALPFFFLGMYEKDGQPFEKILRNIIQTKFIRPPTRPYITDNFYRTLEIQSKTNKEVKIFDTKTTKKAGKETKDYNRTSQARPKKSKNN